TLLARGEPVAAQSSLPVVRATSRVADVRDGDVFQRGYWSIVPEARPDVYVVRQAGAGKRVTFYTDADSISFDVTRGSTHDFVIVLASGDSAFTRIATADPNRLRYTRPGGSPRAADTIPFTLGRGNKIFVRGRVNGSDSLDLMFDTGANVVVLSKSGLRKGANLSFQGTQDYAAFGGSQTVRQSRGNALHLAGLRWLDVPNVAIDRADGDGIIGYNVFEDKVVEIDYDRRIIVVRDSLPAQVAGAAPLPLRLDGGLLFVQAALVNGHGEHRGYFELDTGASWGLHVGEPFAAANRLHGTMETLGERSSGGLGANRVKTELVRLPALRIGGHELRGVPIDLERPSGERPRGDGILGMDVLRRFNTVLDLREYQVWLTPNALVGEAYESTIPPAGRPLQRPRWRWWGS
ncbi:MAG: aspartyl protease family protein, partial [Longimicrobiaceae bacterium]